MARAEVPYTDFPIYREQLASGLGFQPADIAANRAGRLGDGERRTQLRQLTRIVAVTLGFLVFGSGVGVLGLALVLTEQIAFDALVLLGATAVGVAYFASIGVRL